MLTDIAKQQLRKAGWYEGRKIDLTKFDQTAFSVAGKLRDIDVIVTDRKPSDKWLAHFADEGVKCRYPGMQS